MPSPEVSVSCNERLVDSTSSLVLAMKNKAWPNNEETADLIRKCVCSGRVICDIGIGGVGGLCLRLGKPVS